MEDKMAQQNMLDILAEEIQISFLEELHRIDVVKLRKDIAPVFISPLIVCNSRNEGIL